MTSGYTKKTDKNANNPLKRLWHSTKTRAHLGDEVILEVQGGLARAEGLAATPWASRLTAHTLVNGPVLSIPAPVPAQRWFNDQ
jgi:hypothetical protein